MLSVDWFQRESVDLWVVSLSPIQDYALDGKQKQSFDGGLT